MKPLLKWVGGKKWLAPKLQELYKPYQGYTVMEVFAGGLGFSISTEQPKVFANDLNPYLMNLYYCIQNGNLNNTDWKFDSSKEEYYSIRDEYNHSAIGFNINDGLRPDLAMMFYYLNRTCFQGKMTYTNKGVFNNSYGYYQDRNHLLLTDFTEYQKLFENWLFYSDDFECIIPTSEDFVYLDPPYDVGGNVNGITKYHNRHFKWEDHLRLSGWVKKYLYTCPIVISNSNSERIAQLYQDIGLKVLYINCPRNLGGKNREHINVIEILATNF